MIRTTLGLAAALALLAAPATAADMTKEPPGGAYKQVSTLVKLPDFIPGMGRLYVDPATLPAGPFLAYDRDGTLVSTIYMVPLDDLQAQKAFKGLDAASPPVDRVDMAYNPGHPGVEEPHYHVTLWHVSEAAAAGLK